MVNICVAPNCRSGYDKLYKAKGSTNLTENDTTELDVKNIFYQKISGSKELIRTHLEKGRKA